MKIHLAKSAGFCFGVRRAIDIALETAKAHRPVVMLGDIVHNDDVIRMITQAGIKKIKALGPVRGQILLVRAHGTAVSTYRWAERLGYKVIDATCPMVKEIHKIAVDMEEKGYPVIVIGDKKHDEVHGILGQLKHKAIVVDGTTLPPAVRRLKKAAVVVQSTQNLNKVEELAKELARIIPDIKFFNTVCGPTRAKQAEIRSLPLDNDVVIIIGSKRSANTRRLLEIAQSINPKSYLVENRLDMRPEWFRGAASVGVTAGASTPDSTTNDVIAFLNNLP
jgi:(E)-4-hydroxy-3-methyl-but-2-enyl pyrophosphate reductase